MTGVDSEPLMATSSSTPSECLFAANHHDPPSCGLLPDPTQARIAQSEHFYSATTRGGVARTRKLSGRLTESNQGAMGLARDPCSAH